MATSRPTITRKRGPGVAAEPRRAAERSPSGRDVLADVAQRADIRMIELGHRPSFALEAIAELSIARSLLKNHA
jgi:hypothetical protein